MGKTRVFDLDKPSQNKPEKVFFFFFENQMNENFVLKNTKGIKQDDLKYLMYIPLL